MQTADPNMEYVCIKFLYAMALKFIEFFLFESN